MGRTESPQDRRMTSRRSGVRSVSCKTKAGGIPVGSGALLPRLQRRRCGMGGIRGSSRQAARTATAGRAGDRRAQSNLGRRRSRRRVFSGRETRRSAAYWPGPRLSASQADRRRSGSQSCPISIRQPVASGPRCGSVVSRRSRRRWTMPGSISIRTYSGPGKPRRAAWHCGSAVARFPRGLG